MMRTWAVVAGVVMGCVAAGGGGSASGGGCSVAADCQNSEAAKRLGRCGPKDYACVQGTCDVQCGVLCETARADATICTDGRVCTESKNTPKGGGAYCRSNPISCTSVDDCPLYLPGAGEWSCTEGICRFPVFEYRSP